MTTERRLRHLHELFPRNSISLFRLSANGKGPLHYELWILGVICFSGLSAADAIDSAYEHVCLSTRMADAGRKLS